MAEPTRYSTLSGSSVELNNFSGRCGVVPYTITNTGRIAFAFGIDRKTGDITDWGGSKLFGESIHDAARRELKEESDGILDVQKSIKDCLVGYQPNAITFFVNFPNETLIERLPKAFMESGGSDEMKSVHVMSLDCMCKCIEAGRFYTLVSDVLLTCIPYLQKMELENQAVLEARAIQSVK